MNRKTDSLIHGSHASRATRGVSPNPAEKDEIAVEIAGNKITWAMVRNLLCTSLEGGSNYWYFIDKFVEPTVGHVPWGDDTQTFRHLDFPVRAGGALILSDKECGFEGEIKPVNRETLVEGLKVMAAKYIDHFADFVKENDDATTGDVFLQCVCFGEAIYG